MILLDSLIHLRKIVSTLLRYRYDKTTVKPPIPSGIDELVLFMEDRCVWVQDPLWGLLDHIQPVSHMNYQLFFTIDRKIKGDCDDLASYAAWMLLRMGYQAYRINLLAHRHVICVFKDIGTGKYAWFSNQLFSGVWYRSLLDSVKGWVAAGSSGTLGPYYIEILEEDEL